MIIDLNDLKSAAIALLGVFGGYIARMFSAEGKIKNDLAYIRGQLTQVLRMVEDVDTLKLKHVTLEKDHEKTRRDTDAAHARIRELNGALHDLTITIDGETYDR